LDLDLLNSLLTKDILDDMGQVILDDDLEESTAKSTTMLCADGGGSSEASDLCNSDCDDDEDVFAGLLGGDFKMADISGDVNILSNFDSVEWESTFNEFFPQLSA